MATRSSRRRALVRSAPILALAVLATAADAQRGGAHQHGVVKLSLAVDVASVTLQMEAPLDSLVGFERTPRNDAERKALAAAATRLESDPALVRLDTAAQCTLQNAKVTPPAFAADAKGEQHTDLEATYTYKCSNPSSLRSLDLAGLLDAYKRIARVELQVAGSAGQSKQVLKRPGTVLRWGR